MVPRSTSRTVTVAPTTAEPAGSLTVPVTAPEACWALAAGDTINIHKQAAPTAIRKIRFFSITWISYQIPGVTSFIL
jgi:hypothetical protein